MPELMLIALLSGVVAGQLITLALTAHTIRAGNRMLAAERRSRADVLLEAAGLALEEGDASDERAAVDMAEQIADALAAEAAVAEAEAAGEEL